jgi:ABC-type xylose transport system substrate-binding protein
MPTVKPVENKKNEKIPISPPDNPLRRYVTEQTQFSSKQEAFSHKNAVISRLIVV